MKKFYFAFIFLLAAIAARATKRTVLFIGNSYTYTNSMPAMLQSIATAKGDTLVFSQSDPGGYTFARHCVYAPTISLIFSQPWDVVVLQEQSELPAFPPDEVDTEVYPYAHRLDSMVHANDACTQTLFLMTWGHADGDPANCGFYPAICTYSGMQYRLRQSYLEMANDNHADVAPVGAAWQVMRDSFPGLWLYQADSIHPLVSGSYLEASVLYASIFHKPASGCTYLDGLAPADAAALQRIADKVTLDSIGLWQQYGHYSSAMFSYHTSFSAVSFASILPVAAAHTWLFGDGHSDTAANPVHAYTIAGSYIVSHTVSTACFTETQTDTVSVATTGTAAIQPALPGISILQQGNGRVVIKVPAGVYTSIAVYNAQGIIAGTYVPGSAMLSLHLAPGLYVYKGAAANEGTAVGKFIVY